MYIFTTILKISTANYLSDTDGCRTMTYISIRLLDVLPAFSNFSSNHLTQHCLTYCFYYVRSFLDILYLYININFLTLISRPYTT